MEDWLRLQGIVAQLRGPEGCPWDREQTSASLVPSFIEELYEVIDTIERGDAAHLREELGDLMLHIVMQTQIAADAGQFTMQEVLAEICEKLIRRHPHVFGDSPARDTAAVLKQWDEIKRKEKEDRPESASLLAGVPKSFPALLRASKLQAKAAKVGFDWPSVEPVFEKIAEEIGELREAMAAGDVAAINDELGDFIFSAVNLARKLQVEPELALQRASDKFSRRFSAVERLATADNVELKALDLEKLDQLWEKAKSGPDEVLPSH